MCEARHIGFCIILHDSKDSCKKLFKFFTDLASSVTRIHTHVKCYLIVTAAACMELFACIADTFGKSCFYKAVDVLSSHVYLKPACFDIVIYIC